MSGTEISMWSTIAAFLFLVWLLDGGPVLATGVLLTAAPVVWDRSQRR